MSDPNVEIEAALSILRQAGLEAERSKMAPSDIVGGNSSTRVRGGRLFHNSFHLRQAKGHVVASNGGQFERWEFPSMEAAARKIVELRKA